MLSIKPFDIPKGLLIKSIVGVIKPFALEDFVGTSRASIHNKALFTGVPPAPFISLSTDLTSAPQPADTTITNVARFKHRIADDGHAISFVGPDDPFSYRQESALHRYPSNLGAVYKRFNRGVDFTDGYFDVLVKNNMMILLELSGSNAISCTYIDLINNEAGNVFTIAIEDADQPGPFLIVYDAHTGDTLQSIDFVSDLSPHVTDSSISLDKPPKIAHARIDPADLTVSVMFKVQTNHEVIVADPDNVSHGIIDIILPIKIHTSAIDDVTFYHAALAAGDTTILSERTAISLVNYTEHLDYPFIVANLKSTHKALAFNWFPAESVGIKKTLSSNIVCAGRLRDFLRKKVNTWGEDPLNPPNRIILSTDWVNGSGAAPNDGDDMDPDGTTAEPIVVDIISGSLATFTGTSSLKYEIVGSQKFAYAFIDGVRQYISFKPSPVNPSVEFVATVNLKRAKVQHSSTAVVAWLDMEWNSVDANYRLEADYIEKKQVAINYLLDKGDDIWDVAATPNNAIIAMVYDDGSYLEGVNGFGMVVGGNTLLKYLASERTFNEYLHNGVFYSNIASSTIEHSITGADKRTARNPDDTHLQCGYLREDEKVSCVSADRPAEYFDGLNDSIPNVTNKMVVSASGGFETGRVGYTDITQTPTLDLYDGSVLAIAAIVSWDGAASQFKVHINESSVLSGSINQKSPKLLIQSGTALPSSPSSPLTADDFNDVWVTLQDAFDNYDTVLVGGLFATSFILNKVPVPAHYVLAGDGADGSGGGTPRGWRQWNQTLSRWEIVWLDAGGSVEPVIAPTDGDRVWVGNSVFELTFPNTSFYYYAAEHSWRPSITPEFASFSYTESQMLTAEKSGGFVDDSVFFNGSVIKNVSFIQSKMYRIPIPNSANFLYTISTSRETGLPSNNLTKLFVGDKDGNVIEDILEIETNDGLIDITQLSANSDNEHLTLGLIE